MKLSLEFRIILYFILFIIACSIFKCSCDMGESAQKVVKTEFSPEALLKKYEWFKDQSAAIDKDRAQIELYESELKSMDPKSFDKEDKFYYQQRKSELLGIISTHNRLCSEYNSAMSKFNYRFTNVGDLPQGATEPLPREVKPYITNIN